MWTVFVKILSIIVAELSVTRVGRFTRGMNDMENIALTKSVVGEWLSYFRRSIL